MAEVVYSIGVGKLGWQYGTGLKSHGTVTNWCTGREWPVNYMTVISARWWSNMPFRRPVMGRDWVGVELLYNSVHRKFKGVWGSESWRNDAVKKTAHSRELGLRLSNPGEQERHTAMSGGAGEVNMLQFCSISNSLSHITLSIKWEVYFSKNCVARHYCVVVMHLHMSMQH